MDNSKEIKKDLLIIIVGLLILNFMLFMRLKSDIKDFTPLITSTSVFISNYNFTYDNENINIITNNECSVKFKHGTNEVETLRFYIDINSNKTKYLASLNVVSNIDNDNYVTYNLNDVDVTVSPNLNFEISVTKDNSLQRYEVNLIFPYKMEDKLSYLKIN